MGYSVTTPTWVLRHLPRGGRLLELGAQRFNGGSARAAGKVWGNPKPHDYVGHWWTDGGYEYRAIDLAVDAEVFHVEHLNLNLVAYGLPLDLFHCSPEPPQAHVVTNFGTSEHIFNQENVFRFVHEITMVGGWMLHSVPSPNFQHVNRHGFFRYTRMFFEELSMSNGYKVADMSEGDDGCHTVSFQKVSADNFIMPIDIKA